MGAAFDLSLTELMNINITGSTLSEENLLSVPSAVNPVQNVNSESKLLNFLSLSYQNKAFTAASNANYQNEKRNRSQAVFTGKSYNRLGGKTLFSLYFSYQWSSVLESYFTLDNAFDKKSFCPAERQDNIIGATNKGPLFTAELSGKL